MTPHVYNFHIFVYLSQIYLTTGSYFFFTSSVEGIQHLVCQLNTLIQENVLVRS